MLAATAPTPVLAQASPFSNAWFNQRPNEPTAAVPTSQSPSAAAVTAAGLSVEQQQQIAKSTANFNRAADALRAQRQVLTSAATAARSTSFARPDNRTVTDGISRAGLWYARGGTDGYDVTTAAARSGAPEANGLVWRGADLPTQTENADLVPSGKDDGRFIVKSDVAGQTLVTVRQQDSRAILTWQNFDVGRNTTLYFNQTNQAGAPQRDWVALNRVLAGAPDANGRRIQAAPSLILGKIRSDGEVYVINQNGIIFGGSSLVNTNSLVASSLDVGLPFQRLDERNSYFLTNQSGRNNFSFQYQLETDAQRIREFGILKQSFSEAVNQQGGTIRIGSVNATLQRRLATIDEDAVEGDVIVESGARLVGGTLDAKDQPVGLSPDNLNLSRIVLAGPNVKNAGEVVTADGQTALIGARNFSIISNDNRSGLPLDSINRGASYLVGQQDWLATAQAGSDGASARPNPFIATNLNASIFGNIQEGGDVSSAFPSDLPGGGGIGAVQLGLVSPTGDDANFDFSRPGAVGSANNGYLVRTDDRGRRFAIQRAFITPDGSGAAYSGSVVNDGIVSSPRGSVFLRANAIRQDGLIHATTSVNQAGLIDIQAINVFSATKTPSTTPSLATTNKNQTGTVRFTADAVTTILPDDQVQADGTQKTIPSDAASLANFKRSTLRISTDNVAGAAIVNSGVTGLTLPNGNHTRSLGWISPSRAAGLNDGSVEFGAGSLLYAPSGNANIKSGAPLQLANGSVQSVDGKVSAGITIEGSLTSANGQMTDGAILDVSGLADVVRPMESNIVTVARVGQNELADSPLQRDGFIYRQRDIQIDRRVSGTREDGVAFRGTPLFDASGYIDARQQLVTELLTSGGTLDLGGSIAAGKGSLINLAGGFIRYEDGYVDTTTLVTQDGTRTVDIGRASPFEDYSGFAGQVTEGHSRWNTSIVYDNVGVLGRNGRFEAGYLEGGNAGTLKFSPTLQSTDQFGFVNLTPTAAPTFAFDGKLNAGTITGPYQRRGSGYFDARLGSPQGGTLDLSALLVRNFTVARAADIAARQAVLPDTFLPSTVARGALINSLVFENQYWSSEELSRSGIGTLRIGGILNGAPTARISIGTDALAAPTDTPFNAEATQLALANGGALALRASVIDVAGKISVRSGSVSAELLPPSSNASSTTSFTLGSRAVIDVSGLFTNDADGTRDDFLGHSFVDGGSVSISQSTGSYQFPITTLVDLKAGSRIELSSGGNVQRNRRLASTGNAGLSRGVGGSLNIALGSLATPLNVRLDADGIETADAALRLNGAINAFGFQGGGTFRLVAPFLRVGAGLTGGEGGEINLAPSLFTDHGFGAFDLTAAFSAQVAEGTQLILQQKQFLPSTSLLSATSIGEAAIVSQYAANSLQRTPVNFSIAGKGFTDSNSKSRDVNGTGPAEVIKNSFTADNALIIGRDASILGDPRALLNFSADGQLTFEGGTQNILAEGGTIRVQQRAGTVGGLIYDGIPSPSGFVPSYNTGLIKSGAFFDASGVFLQDLRQEAYKTGVLLSGGSVSLLGMSLDPGLGVPPTGDVGAFYALSGSVIDVSGARADIESVSEAGLAPEIVRQSIASAAGTISLAGTTSKAMLIAKAGDANAAGGTLNLRANLVTQAQNLDIDGLDLAFRPVSPFVDSFAADLLNGSGIDALNIIKGTQFGGAVSVSLGRSLSIVDGRITASSDQRVKDALGVANVSLDAPYVRLGGLALPLVGGAINGASAETGSRLSVGGSARHIDILGNMSSNGFADTRIASQGDIRFLPGTVFNQLNDGRGPQILSYRTALTATGDLTLAASQIYPATEVDAEIRALFSEGKSSNGLGSATLTIEQIGKSGETPLSAGGSLTLVAGTIEQNGTLRVPLGSITFGKNDPSDIVTQSVVLKAGSLTSTSAAGKLIPYGETRNLTDWVYPRVFDNILTAPPDKSVSVFALSSQFDGATNGLAAAEIDLSGGGDVYATEFVPGLGGQRQILTTSLTTDRTAPVYAIVPGVQPFAAPVDLFGYSNLVPDIPGQTITLLDDVPGLAAGTYTLLPGAYATLPGAFRVQVQPTPTTEIKAGTVLPQLDGSFIVAGKSGINGTQISSSLNVAYRVSPKESWSQYSDIRTSLGSTFFANLAARRGVASPPLPGDAGRLSLTLSGIGRTLETDALLRFDRATGGRGGRVDISAERIAVVSDALLPNLEASLADYLILSPSEIDAFGSTSLLLGGTRTSDIEGDKLTVGARDIRIATNEADPLENPELLFATAGTIIGVDDISGLEVPQLVANRIQIDAGSAVRASGSFSGGTPSSLIFGRNVSVADAGTDLSAFGDGALLRVSNAGPVAITRYNSLPGSQSLITVASDPADRTVLQGGQSLQFDSSGDTRLDDSTRLGGDSVDLFGNRLSLVRGSADQTVIGQGTLDLLAGSRILSLRGRESVSIGQPLAIKAAVGAKRIERLTINTPTLIANDFQGGSLQLDAQTVALTNEFAASIATAALGDGTFEIDAETIQLTGNDHLVRGIDTFDFAATKGVNFGEGKGHGALRLAGDITLATPQITLAEGSTQTLSTTGSILSWGTGAAVPTGGPASIGGRLSLEAAGEIRISNLIDARAGVFEVKSAGDIILDTGSKINAKGYTQSFADKDVILGAGRVSLASSAGGIRIASGATVDVSADPRGNAGTFEATIGADKVLDLSGTLLGTGASGGTFRLNSNGAVVLDTLAQQIVASGFNREVSVRSGKGNLSLSATPITANIISFSADDRSVGNGFVSINTTLDASGANGGTIELFGARGVTLSSSGALLAAANGPVVDDRGGRGGIVRIGTSVLSPDTIVQNEGGVIDLAAGSRIDVSDARDASGASLYSLSRGNGGAEVQIRAPIINNDVAVTIGSTISGARNVILEGFHRFTTGNSAFDGIVDPAGHFTSAGRYVQGTWRDPYGGIVQPGDVQNGVTNPVSYTEASYFTPETIDPVTGARRSVANQAHVNFYQNTLRNFVVDPGVNADRFADISNFAFRPGIDLVNSDLAVNGGDIAVLSNFNLGAGTSPDQLFFRTARDHQPGFLTLRAAGDIRISATISDGFFETSPFNSFRQYVLTDSFGDTRLGSRGARDAAPVNPITGIAPPLPRGLFAFGIRDRDVENYSLEANIYYRNYDYFIKYLWSGYAQFSTQFTNVGGGGFNGVAGGILAYAPLGYAPPTDYDAYSVAYQTRYLAKDVDEANADPRRTFQFQRVFRPALPVRPTDDAFYPAYAANYLAYLAKLNQMNADGILDAAAASAPLAPVGISNAATFSAHTRSPANDIANNPTAGNPFSDYTAPPLQSGDSFAMRFVAGSKTDSANPLSANGSQPLATFSLGNEQTTAAEPKGGRDIIRSGTGAIDIVAAKDIRIINANDVIYTAGNAVPVAAGFVDTAKITPAIAEESRLPYDRLRTPGLFAQRGGDVRLLADGSFMGAQDRADDFGRFRLPMSATDTSNKLAFVFDSQLFSGSLAEFDAFGSDDNATSERRVSRRVSHFLRQQGTSSANPLAEGQFGGSTPRLVGGFVGQVANSQSAEWIDIGRITGSVATAGGGNVSVIAGNAITDLNATIISTLQVAGGKSADSPAELFRYGGGDLLVKAGGDIAGATLFVGRGDAQIESGGAIRQQVVTDVGVGPTGVVSAFLDGVLVEDSSIIGQNYFDNTGQVLLAGAALPQLIRDQVQSEQTLVGDNRLTIENGVVSITARNGIALRGVNQMVADNADYSGGLTLSGYYNSFNQLGQASALRLLSTTGDVDIDNRLFAESSAAVAPFATPRFAAIATRGDVLIDGSLNLAPSATGNLDLLANGSLILRSTLLPRQAPSVSIRMDDRDRSALGSPLAPETGLAPPPQGRFDLHSSAATPLHFADLEPSRLIALNGDIVSGRGLDINPVNDATVSIIPEINLAESARISAGRDIINMRFTGQNTSAASITSITAGRDINYSIIPLLTTGFLPLPVPGGSTFTIGGAGQMSLVAGRSIALSPSIPAYRVNSDPGTSPFLPESRGLFAVGNELNPYLPEKSADLDVLFGVGPSFTQPGQINLAAFIGRYINPAKASTVPTNYASDLTAFVNGRLTLAGRTGNLGFDAAIVEFGSFGEAVQRSFIEGIFFKELQAIARPDDPRQFQNFARAYTAIDTLFPAPQGYSSNLSDPAVTRSTGDFDFTSALVRTSQDSSITILGPGGNIVAGGLAEVASQRGNAGSQGVLTLRGGNINIFIDGNLLVNTSRVFTLQGGDITIFATNGNIDAGRGRRTSSFLPPIVTSFLPTTTATVDFGGLVTGAGIGTLQTLPNATPADVFLLAPRGDIDAGDAGIRSSRDLFIVANRVLNADNVQVAGKSTGVPTIAKTDVGGLTQAGNASKANNSSGGDPVRRQLDGTPIIQVQLNSSGSAEQEDERRKKPKK